MIRQEFLILQKIRVRLFLNTTLWPGKKNLTRFLTLGALGSLFVAADYLFFRRILIYFNDLPLDVGEILIIQLLNLLCLTFFSMLVFSNVIASISTLYMSRDLDFLISSPIPIADVFLSKFILTLINSSWMALIFGLPIFIAYGNVYYASWMYYVYLPALLIPFLLAPSGIGILVTMTLMRFFPARKTYQLLSFVGIFFIAGIVMYLRFLQPEKFLGKDVSESLIIEFVEKLKAPDYEWLPSSMMANALKAGVVSDWEIFMSELFWLWVVALAVSAITIAVASRIYFSGWVSSYGSRYTAMPVRERLFYRIIRMFIAWAPSDARALLMKDMKLFWRDPAQWSQLFMLGALVIVYIFNIRNLPLDTIYLKNVVSVMNIGLAGVVLAAVAARFVFAATSMEGRSFWAILSAPVGFRRFLWTKFFLYVFPLAILSETLVVVSNFFLGVDSYIMAVSIGTIAAVTIGVTGLGVGMGAIYPKFDFENVAEVSTTTGAIMYMIISLAYIGFCVSLISGPVYVHLKNSLLGAGQDESGMWIYFAALAFATVLFVVAPIRIGASSLKKVEI